MSLNINTNNCSGATVKLIAQSSQNTYEEVIPVDEYAASGAYAFASLNFDVTNSSETFQIKIQITGASSGTQTIMIDNVMLAKSIGVSPYSMVGLGNFENCSVTSLAGTTIYVSPTALWTRSDTTNVTIVDSLDSNYGQAMKIIGSLDSARNASQTVFTAASSSDLNTPKIYKVSGFAKANRQMYNTSSRFALKVDVYYYNETEPKTYWYDYANTPADTWQFTNGTFDVCADGGSVQSIKVSCVYDHQSGLGAAYFDNISVIEVRDGSAESYTYYDSGMPKTYDNGGYKEWYFYANDNTSQNLTRKITSTNGVTDYTYDTKNRVITEVYYEYTGEYTGTLPSLTSRVKTTYTYNTYGLITNTTMRTVQFSGSTLIDTSPANIISSSKTYNLTAGSRIFGSMSTETDSLGRITRYFYASTTGKLTAVINPDQTSGMVYAYDAMGNLTLVESATYINSTPAAQTNAESVEYTYSQNKLTEIKSESTTYTLTYDVFGNSTSVQAGSYTLASYTYNANNGKLNTITYGNQFVVNYVYDELDRVSETWYTKGAGTSTKAYSYEYDANGNMCKFTDYTNNRTYRYKYDDQNRMTGIVEASGSTNLSSTVTTYDEQSRIHSLSYSQDYSVSSTPTSLVTKYTYSYNDRNNLSGMTVTSGNASFSFVPSYDALDRMYSRSASMTTSLGTVTNTTTYGFTSNSTSRSLQISQLISTVGTNSTTYNYTYDSNGNITQITDSLGVIQNKYYYDDLSQLIREDNRGLNKTYVNTYDNAGNITSKKTYVFTTEALGTCQNTQNYSYNDATWGDLLTNVGSTAIEYDNIGNPTTIAEGEDSFVYLTWQGRLLKQYDLYLGGNTVDYNYNADGIRTYKNIVQDFSGERHEYTLDGSRIILEKITYFDLIESEVEVYDEELGEYVYEWVLEETVYDTVYLCYYYDEAGQPIAVKYIDSNEATYFYYFEKNLQGDIVAVYNASGTKVISYTYDAWGNFTESYPQGWSAASKASLNPFRYRGYYYDTETSLYYLNSRYYNPQWGRFINADGVGLLGANNDITSYNIYAYCSNNPVHYKDQHGYFLFTAIGAVVGGVFGAAAALIEGKSGREVLASAANGAIAGAIAGVAADVIAVTGGTAAAVIVAYTAAGAIGSGLGSLAESKINGKDMRSKEVRDDAIESLIWGGIFGAIGGAIAGPSTSMMKSVAQNAGKKAITKGITVGYAIKKTLKSEVRHLGSSIVEEGLNNFTSWFAQKSIGFCFGR